MTDKNKVTRIDKDKCDLEQGAKRKSCSDRRWKRVEVIIVVLVCVFVINMAGFSLAKWLESNAGGERVDTMRMAAGEAGSAQDRSRDYLEQENIMKAVAVREDMRLVKRLRWPTCQWKRALWVTTTLALDVTANAAGWAQMILNWDDSMAKCRSSKWLNADRANCITWAIANTTLIGLTSLYAGWVVYQLYNGNITPRGDLNTQIEQALNEYDDKDGVTFTVLPQSSSTKWMRDLQWSDRVVVRADRGDASTYMEIELDSGDMLFSNAPPDYAIANRGNETSCVKSSEKRGASSTDIWFTDNYRLVCAVNRAPNVDVLKGRSYGEAWGDIEKGIACTMSGNTGTNRIVKGAFSDNYSKMIGKYACMTTNQQVSRDAIDKLYSEASRGDQNLYNHCLGTACWK